MDAEDTTNYENILIFSTLHYSLDREFNETLHVFMEGLILILKSEMRTF
jgi:hypothetical protein